MNARQLLARRNADQLADTRELARLGRLERETESLRVGDRVPHSAERDVDLDRAEAVDLERREEYPAAETVPRLMAWTAPMRAELGIDIALPELNGAQRQRRMIETGAGRQEIYAATVAETRATYAENADTPAEMTK